MHVQFIHFIHIDFIFAFWTSYINETHTACAFEKNWERRGTIHVTDRIYEFPSLIFSYDNNEPNTHRFFQRFLFAIRCVCVCVCVSVSVFPVPFVSIIYCFIFYNHFTIICVISLELSSHEMIVKNRQQNYFCVFVVVARFVDFFFFFSLFCSSFHSIHFRQMQLVPWKRHKIDSWFAN